MKPGQRSRGGRQGNVFALRLTPEQRAELQALCSADVGPRNLGPWLVWRAQQHAAGIVARVVGSAAPGAVIPELGEHDYGLGRRGTRGTTNAGGRRRGTTVDGDRLAEALTALRKCKPGLREAVVSLIEENERWVPELVRRGREDPPIAERLILDLCAGSGAWSEPYKHAGYPVVRVTLPARDVRTFTPPDVKVWGVLAAPPCTEFSLAKNGRERDFVEGLATVNACMRVVLSVRPRWWALENPVGLLGRWLGRPRFVFEPFQFGDPWSKRTALWGEFQPPASGPFVDAIDGGGPLCVECHPDDPRVCSIADHRAVTPAGFARAFFEANP